MGNIRWTRLLVLCALGAFAAQAGFAQMKVAVINSNKAIVDTAEIKKAQADLEARYKPRTDQMEKLQRELTEIQESLRKMAGKLTAQAEAEMTASGQKKQRDYQRLQEDVQADVDRERGDILGRAGKRMQEIVQKLAEAGGFDVVIDVSNTVFFKPALEITKEATAAYDKAYTVK